MVQEDQEDQEVQEDKDKMELLAALKEAKMAFKRIGRFVERTHRGAKIRMPLSSALEKRTSSC